MSFIEKPPYYACPHGKIGLLSSMYTCKEYRRQGIARELLSRVVQEAKDYGCDVIQITASDMGMKLYEDFGFVKNDHFMQYQLTWWRMWCVYERSIWSSVTFESPSLVMRSLSTIKK